MTILAPNFEFCPQCATQLAPAMLACPGCSRLVHADKLAALAQTSRDAAGRGDISTALANWRDALDLLPDGSRQHQVISAKIAEMSRNLPPNAIPAAPSTGPAGQKSATARVATSVGAFGLLLWKLKALLLGLTKGRRC